VSRVALFVLYVIAAKAGLSLAAVNPSATAVWPPTGIAIAACLLMGRPAWPAIFAGALVANLTNAGSVATSLGIAVGNTLEGVLGAYFTARFVSRGSDAAESHLFDRAPDVFRFAALAGCVATCVSATIGVTSLALGGYAQWSTYWAVWLTWWLGDASGALIFAPFIIILTQNREPLPREQWLELGAFTLVLVADTLFVFGGLYEPTRHYPLAFLSIPPILWAAFRFGPRETSAGVAVLSLIAAWNTHRGIGPFAVAGIASLIVLQAFMATVAITALAITALVTERKRVEAERLALLSAERTARTDAEASAVAKDEFLAMLGHELRNPIAAIKMAMHVLGGSPSPGEADRARDVIQRQSDHLTHLVDDLLDATRIATGKLTLTREPVDLAAVTTGAVAALTTAGGAAHCELKVTAAPVWVEGDATRLEQVVTNLVGNAFKYTPAGGSVRVTVTGDDHDAVLAVADTGSGIRVDLLPRVFDLFTQGPRELDRSPGGLGIGLTLVKRVVELHGGRVDVRSDGEGRGSEFTVRIPAVAPPPGFERAGADARAASASVSAASRRVLLVEDQRDMREMLRFALEDAGHLVFEAADGPAAIQAVERFEPHVALVDIGLPGFDGYEVARRIRSMSGGAPMLLIALTGYGQPEDRRRSSDAGFDVHFVKPIDVDRLKEVIKSYQLSADSFQ